MPAVIGGNGSTCVLLLHAEGDDGSQIFTDKSAGGLTNTIAANEEARISWDDQKFWESSIYCDGGGSYVQVAASSNYRFTTLPFSIDCWIHASDLLRPYVFAWYLDDDNLFALERMTTSGSSVRWRLRYRLAGVDIVSAAGAAPHAFTGWVHVQVIRDGVNTSVYLGGSLYISDAQATAYTCNLEDWPLYIGGGIQTGVAGLQTLHGYIDEFRILKNEAPANVVPSNPYGPTFEQYVTGRHHIRTSFEQRVRGLYGVVWHPFEQHMRGTHHVYDSFAPHMRGTHHIFDSFAPHVRGTYGIALRPFEQHVRGRHRVYESYAINIRGLHSVHSGAFEQHVRGTHIVRAGFAQDVKGTHHLRFQFTQDVKGMHRIADTTLEGYELFHGAGSEPDLTAAPWETFSSLPHETAAISGAGLHYFVLRYRHRWNLSSQNIQSWVVELDGSDDEIMRAPSDAVDVQIAAAANATALLTAFYYYDADTTRQADQWLIYITDDGSDPDPVVDTPVVVTMAKADGVAKLVWTSPAYDDLDTAKAIVRTRRLSPLRDSISTTIVSVVVTTQGPASVDIGQYQEYGGGPVPV